VAPETDLKTKIDGFPGYGDDEAREKSDELVRSYLGERLAELQQRLEPLDASLNDRLGDLLMRTVFTNQAVHKLYDGGSTDVDLDAVARADEQTIALADQASSIDSAELGAYLISVSKILDEREAAMSGRPSR